jgi:putative ABC transport system permease protein
MQNISLFNLAFAFIPVAIVLAIYSVWALETRTLFYALIRMLLQLFAIGYLLTWIFARDESLIIVGILAFMLAAASWIALRPLGQRNPALLGRAFIAIAVGGLLTLVLVTQAVLNIEPWYAPELLLPLGGMIFAGSMNAVSLAAERLAAEAKREINYATARQAALQTALIPIINSLFAVGLVSLPGMMTGQILSGVDPLIAARYQIVVMCMLFGSAGISAACFLLLAKDDYLATSKLDPKP